VTATVPSVRAVGAVDPDSAATRAHDTALQVLLRCWLRETDRHVPAPGRLRVDLPATGRAVLVDITRPSPTGAHGIAGCRSLDGRLLGVEEVASALTREAARSRDLPDQHAEDALARIVESARRAASYAGTRAQESSPPAGLPAWLRAEQGLVAGHPWHPMTKSRDGLPEEEDRRYAPESRGHFRLHWYAADPDVVSWDSTGVDVPALMRRVAGDLRVPSGRVPVPAHPWQAAHLSERPAAAELVAGGALLDLGPAGDPWWATSSLRTVARPGEDVMLKLSMGLRVTNSRRENLREELALAVRTAALVDAGLGDALAAAHPQFALVRDPAWVGVDAEVGLDTVIREQPFAPADRAWCAGALVDARPDLAEPVAARLVRDLAARRRLPVAEAASVWFHRWLRAVAEPLLWLHGTWGIGLEAHLQNVLVGLDGEGLPTRGWYRDNQGWYVSASRTRPLERLLPHVGDGVPLVFDDDLVTGRLVYYLGVNHLFGVAAALASADLADESDLLGVLTDFLRRHAGGRSASPAARMLLEATRLPVKANLLTGVDGRDELAGSVAAQSVYVQIRNPLQELLR
jgi:siderophore synthetase component